MLDISDELGHLLYPEELIKFRGNGLNAKQFVELMQSEWEKYIAEGTIPSYGNPLAVIRGGKDYLGHSENKKRDYFWVDNTTYHLILPGSNAYNSSFGISLFPEEAKTIRERIESIYKFGNPRFPNGHIQVKTLLLYDQGTNKHYLIIAPGMQRVNLNNVKSGLNAKNLTFADDPQGIIGRESGAVGPLVQEQCFTNIDGMLFADDLLVGYSKPCYSIPIDKRAAIVLADTNDLIAVLRKIQGFPKIGTYNNQPTLSQQAS